MAAHTLSIPGVTISGELGRGARSLDYRARWGEQTWDEMMIGFVDYTYPLPAEEKKP